MKVWVVTEATHSTFLGLFTEQGIAANSVWLTHKEAHVIMEAREISPSLLHVHVYLTGLAKDGNVPTKTYVIEEVEVSGKGVVL